MRIKSIALLFYLALPATLAACSYIFIKPFNFNLATPIVTPVYETIAARLATAKISMWLTPTTLPTENEAMASVSTFTPDAIKPFSRPAPQTGLMQAAAQKEPCDLVNPGLPMDVTIPDGTQFHPGEAFSKTWRLINSGSCFWTSDYVVVWFSGQSFHASNQQKISNPVLPGNSVEITVDLSAPDTPGFYQSNWKLRNPAGKLFGLGPNGDSPFWVRIEVVDISTATPTPQSPQALPLSVYAHGVVDLKLNDSLNLNTGELNQKGKGDLLFTLSPQEKPQFIPENGARLAFFGKEAPTETECQLAALDNYPILIFQYEAGAYFCYCTSQGLPGFAHVSIPPKEDSSLSLDFVTWYIP